jgi:hypothetical protein
MGPALWPASKLRITESGGAELRPVVHRLPRWDAREHDNSVPATHET